MDDLHEDERVIAAATAGPWTVDNSPTLEMVEQARSVLTQSWEAIKIPAGNFPEGVWAIWNSSGSADAAFIARARTRYPALVQEVRELRKLNGALHNALLEFSRLRLRHGSELIRAIALMDKALEMVGPASGKARHEEGA